MTSQLAIFRAYIYFPFPTLNLTKNPVKQLIKNSDLTVLLLSCGYLCSVSLPLGAVGWSVRSVIVEFPNHTHLSLMTTIVPTKSDGA